MYKKTKETKQWTKQSIESKSQQYSIKFGSYYRIIFANEFAVVRFFNGITDEERIFHQSYPRGIENIAEIFEEINQFEKLDTDFMME